MKNLQIGLIVVGAMTAVFALGASILGALERAPALRGTAAVRGSPSRAIAIPELIGAVALIAFGIVSPPTSRQAGASVMMVGGGTGILVHAGSAFMRGDRVRQRVGRVGLGLLDLSACIAAYYLDRHELASRLTIAEADKRSSNRSLSSLAGQLQPSGRATTIT